jgi:putative DNA primase/helicase
MTDMLASALEFASRGWPVFPIRALGKTPLTARGFKDATTDPTAIRVWWAKWPLANIGVATGSASVVAVDIDGDEGENSLVALTAQYGPLPQTLESRTGRGRHLFFVVSGSTIRNDTGRKLGRGIDVRGAGGYVVVPPSVHESGKPYEWIRSVPPAPLPDWLLKKLSATLRVKNNNDGHALIAAGQRNNTLASLAGTMRRRGMSRAAILAALLEHNREFCDAPLPEQEVQGIADSVCRYPHGPSTVGSAGAADSSAASAQSDDEGSPFLGDQANAERLASAYAGMLIYLADRQIRCAWDGRVWRLHDDGAWGRAAIETVRRMYLAAAREIDADSRERTAKRAVKAEGRMAQMMTLAQVSTKLERLKLSETFDQDPRVLNVANGILNLASGELGPHRADALLTKITGVSYVSNAKCDMFENFLAHTFGGNPGLIEYVTRFMGYALSGFTKEQAFWFFYGPKGATSKSTFVKLLRLLAGEYATTLPTQALIIDRNKNQDYGLAELAGVRLATAVEIGQGRHLDSAMVKQITGQDPIKACRKYENYFEFRSAAKLVIATNHRPTIRETSDAIWRRVKSVPFLVVVPEEARVDNLEEKLVQKEGPGILALAVRGFQRYLADGLQEPKEIRSAIEEYRESEDVVARFIDEHCVVEIGARVAYGTLYARFVEIAKANGEHLISSDSFAKELERLGYHQAKSGSVRYRLGLRLRESYESEPSS